MNSRACLSISVIYNNRSLLLPLDGVCIVHWLVRVIAASFRVPAHAA